MATDLGRVIVAGDSGSGKSTVGAQIARQPGVELIELDACVY
jgi:adenylate kinase family enzyme